MNIQGNQNHTAMKNIICIFSILIASVTAVTAQQDTLQLEPTGQDGDSVEYELIVMDPGYETFLLTQKPMEFYSQAYYETWNRRYVTEWNYRHMHPMVYGELYETYIDYRPGTDYGLELNYKLFYYFRFFEKENGVDLLPEKVF